MTTIAIIGGGPAGAVAAIALAGAGFDTVVLDANKRPRQKIGETLPPAVRPLLERLELLDRLDVPEHRRSFGNRSYWGSDEPIEQDFMLGTFGAGWHLDRVSFETMLSEAAIEAGARWCWDHHAVDARWSGRWTLESEGPDALVDVTADFVIDASGRPGRFARGAGAGRRHFDRLVGVAVILDASGVDGALDGFTMVEALPGGWWYSAPLADSVAAVYMTDGDLLDAAARTSAGWHAQIAGAPHTRERLAPWLGEGHIDIQPHIMAAGSTRLINPAGDGWLAVGDAAASFDPLSSQGIASAITTGYYGACAIADHFAGNLDALDAYCALVTSMFDDYMKLLGEHYASERRWPQQPFWSRRHAGSVLRPRTRLGASGASAPNEPMTFGL